jgi:hypothetical protein
VAALARQLAARTCLAAALALGLAPRAHACTATSALEEADASDATGDDAGGQDASPPRRDARPDAAEAGPDFAFRLTDGGAVRGPLVALYDHAAFWDAAAETTYAVFDPTEYASYPDDRSVRFVSSRDLSLPVGRPAAGPHALPDPRFRDFLRDQGLALFRPPLAGVSLVVRGNDGYHLEENGYGHFAWDLVKLYPDGARFHGDGGANADYATWDEPVLLPSAGYVVEVVRDGRDNLPGTTPPDAVNNFVGVWLGGHYYVYILHFRQGTIPSEDDGTCEPAKAGIACVKVGAWLPAGTYLGRAGNAGVTLEPHVHVTLLYYDVAAAAPRTWSVPAEFADVYLSDRATGPARLAPFAVPKTGDFISAAPF